MINTNLIYRLGNLRNGKQLLHLLRSEIANTNHSSELCTNMAKTEFYHVSCKGINLDFIGELGRVATFPCYYLGLHLHYKKPSRAILNQVIQKIGDRLPGWKSKFMSYPGRELMVKLVFSSMSTYFLTVSKMPKWGLSRIDKFKRGFMWKGQDQENVRGGHCQRFQIVRSTTEGDQATNHD
jgi:hypothetical protein